MKVYLTCKLGWGHMIRLKIGADESGWTLSLSVSSRPNGIMFMSEVEQGNYMHLTCQYIVLFACFLAHGSRCSLRSLAWLEVEEAWNMSFFDYLYLIMWADRQMKPACCICDCWQCLQQFPFAWLFVACLAADVVQHETITTWHDTIRYPCKAAMNFMYHIDSAKMAMHLDLRYMPCWQDGFTRHGIHVKSDHMTYAIIIWSCAISRHSKSLCDFSFICPVTSLVIGTTLWSVKLFHLLWASGWRTLLRLTPGSVWRQGTLFAQNTKSTWMSGIWMKKH